MKIGRRHLLIGLGALALTAHPAFAQDAATQSIIRQLERQGFVISDIRRTLLGRVRIIARRGEHVREIVFDPRNGVILRDFTSGEEGPQISGNDPYPDEDDDYDDGDGDDDDDDDDSDDDGDDDDD